MSAEVATRNVTDIARGQWSENQVALIRDTVATNCSPAELHLFLEIAARHQLDPFVGEIYAAKMPGKNGAPGRMVPIVGRNGWLKMARRNPDFVRVDGDVVHQGDKFTVARNAEGHRTVTHEWSLAVTQDKDGQRNGRGPVMGAWAEVQREGFAPTFFYAPVHEYKPSSPPQSSPWLRQESVMIAKCAMVAALRVTYEIGGVYDEAEIESIRVPNVAGPVEESAVDWGEDKDLATWMQALHAKVEEVAPGMWRPERLRLKLDNADEFRRRSVAEEMISTIKAKGGEVPEWPSSEEVSGEVVS